MKLKISKRDGKHKSEISQMRHKGDIPGILYGLGVDNVKICIGGEEFQTALRQMQKGFLPTKVFEFELDGKTIKAIAKDVHYHPVTYQVQHVDLLVLQDKVPVKVNIPLDFVGEADCVGIKLGGFLRPVLRHVRVQCLPKDMPEKFEIDVREMKINNSKRVSDLKMPAAVKSLVASQAVVVTIAKR